MRRCSTASGQLGDQQQVWMSHGDRSPSMPPGFASSPTANAPFAVIADEKRKYYGVQFHPEVVHTPRRRRAARATSPSRSPASTATGPCTPSASAAIAQIRAQVGKGRVICGLSGGVDSSVAAVLMHEAIGDQLTCVFVDHGLMRADEGEQVVALFRDHYNIPLIHADAAEIFLSALDGVSDPEAKRKTIGATFIDVFEARSREDRRRGFPGAGHALSRRDRKRLLHRRPLRHHQVASQCRRPAGAHEHEAGRAACANCSRTRCARWPRTGPARACQPPSVPRPGPRHPHPGDITKEKLDLLRQADAVYLDEIRNAGLYDEIWQAFAVLLPVQTVGVMGDGRTYDYVLRLRAVTSTDGMTADYYPFDMSSWRDRHRIINEVKGVNRVMYDVTSKPPGTIEWE